MIYVEKNAIHSEFIKHFQDSSISFAIANDDNLYTDKKSEIILKSGIESFCRPCPATPQYNCCNYYNTDVMEGCPFDCSYCILQAYLPHKNIVVSGETEGIRLALKSLIAAGVRRRIGTGELSDSLALDHIFPFSKVISPIINSQNIIQFEYKTKSDNISNLLNLNPKNIVVAWSINPQNVIDSEEAGSASLQKRLSAAKTCAEAGYKVAFHFDPILYYDGFAHDYAETVELMLSTIPETAVEYISASTFRGPTALIDKMRERTAVPKFLQGDFVKGLDMKVRYFKPLRIEMLKHVTSAIRKGWQKPFIYLCMEHSSVWQAVLGIPNVGGREEVESLFPWYQK